MKRTLVIVLVMLLVVLAATWGVWTYRQYVSYRTPIPQDATLVIKANVDALLRDLAWNALWNRAYYDRMRDDGQPRLDRKRLQRLGISVPANVFLSRIAGLKSCYFGVLKVKDAAALHLFLTQELNMDTLTLTHDTGILLHSKHLMANVTDRRVALAITTGTSLDTAKVATVLADLVKEQNSVAISDSRFAALRTSNEHFAFMGDRVSGELKGENGGIHVSVMLQTELPETSLARPDFSTKNIASLWLNVGLENLLQPHYRIGEYQLSRDSLLAHYQGALALEWRGTIVQADTTITYDYDDDFELVEKVTLIEREVPELSLTVHADTTGLSGYLHRQGLLDAGGDNIDRDAFPLYQVQVSRQPTNILQFHTSGTATDLPASSSYSNELFYLNVDFRQMASQDLSPLLVRYIQPFTQAEAVGKPVAPHQLAIQGTLSMGDPRINGFAQLVSIFDRVD